jgi:hypothetical protein
MRHAEIEQYYSHLLCKFSILDDTPRIAAEIQQNFIDIPSRKKKENERSI